MFGPCKGIRIPDSVFREIFACRIRAGIRGSFACEPGIQLKESGIPLKIGIQNPSSTKKDLNQVPGIWNPRRGIQNPRLSWISLHGAICQ